MPMNSRLLRPRLSGDPDALRYIAAVQQADGNTLEPAIRKAITDFVVGCKQDGIWSAIKASCILMGARTLSGALTPLVGAAPTNNNFVSGDYNRKTGLVGDGSTKYLDSNRANNADPQDSNHNAVYATQAVSAGATVRSYIGSGGIANGANHVSRSAVNTANLAFRFRSSVAFNPSGGGGDTGFLAASRSIGSSFEVRFGGATVTYPDVSVSPTSGNVLVFSRGDAGLADGRIAFYSIGESLGLALLDSRVSTLYTAIGAAI